MKTVKLGVDDGCRGLETPRGQIFPVKDHVVELPEREAKKFLGAGRTDHLHVHKPVGVGWSPTIERAWDRVFGREHDVSEGS